DRVAQFPGLGNDLEGGRVRSLVLGLGRWWGLDGGRHGGIPRWRDIAGSSGWPGPAVYRRVGEVGPPAAGAAPRGVLRGEGASRQGSKVETALTRCCSAHSDRKDVGGGGDIHQPRGRVESQRRGCSPGEDDPCPFTTGPAWMLASSTPFTWRG